MWSSPPQHGYMLAEDISPALTNKYIFECMPYKLYLEFLYFNPLIVEVSMDSHSIDNVHHSGNIDVESSREEIYNFLGLSWPPTRLLHLSEGMFLQDLRLKELKFKLSPTQIQTPTDGNCINNA